MWRRLVRGPTNGCGAPGWLVCRLIGPPVPPCPLPIECLICVNECWLLYIPNLLINAAGCVAGCWHLPIIAQARYFPGQFGDDPRDVPPRDGAVQVSTTQYAGTFVDLGSGRGTAVAAAAIFGFQRVVGIELSSCACVQKLDSPRNKSANVNAPSPGCTHRHRWPSICIA